MVVRIGERERCTERDAVTHEVVKGELRREAVQRLLDDGTVLVVVAGRDTEVGLFTTTRDGQVVILAPTSLLHFLHPVGVVVPVFEFCPRAVVVDFVDVCRGGSALRRIVVHLLQHHRVVVTVQQVVALRLPVGLHTQRVVNTGSTTRTTLSGNRDNTVGTTRTPDGSCGGVLQYVDLVDIRGVHREQRSVSFLVGRGEVEVLVGIIEDVSVDNDQRLGRSVDGGHTTKAHRST